MKTEEYILYACGDFEDGEGCFCEEEFNLDTKDRNDAIKFAWKNWDRLSEADKEGIDDWGVENKYNNIPLGVYASETWQADYDYLDTPDRFKKIGKIEKGYCLLEEDRGTGNQCENAYWLSDGYNILCYATDTDCLLRYFDEPKAKEVWGKALGLISDYFKKVFKRYTASTKGLVCDTILLSKPSQWEKCEEPITCGKEHKHYNYLLPDTYGFYIVNGKKFDLMIQVFDYKDLANETYACFNGQSWKFSELTDNPDKLKHLFSHIGIDKLTAKDFED